MRKLLFLFLLLSTTVVAAPSAKLLFTVSGLESPESAVYDSDEDAYFVSNIHGDGAVKDNNGFISKIRADGKIESLKFISAGENGITLNAPKGLVISADTLWVADIDAVRSFDKRTGKPKQSYDFQKLGAVFLNDITATSGDVYVSDTALHFNEKGDVTARGPYRLYCVCNGQPQLLLEDPALEGPNGLLSLQNPSRLLIVQLDGKNVLQLSPASKTLKSLAQGPGGFDGIAAYKNGYLISSLDTSSIYFLEGDTFTEIIKGIENPADIGLDAKRSRLLIPSFSLNQMQVWQLTP